MQLVKITPFLWFNDNAQEAVSYYLDIFPGSEITRTTYYPQDMQDRGGQVLTISFTLSGNELTALNGGPQYKFTEAVSLAVHCRDQQEIDHYWDKLVDYGTPMACGWLRDKFGLAWQIVPEQFFDMIDPSDPERAARVLAAMNTMIKFDLAELEAAYRGSQ